MPDWAILVAAEGEGQQMAIKVVSSDSESHQRHHLDLYASNRKSEVERLLRLGAHRLSWLETSDSLPRHVQFRGDGIVEEQPGQS